VPKHFVWALASAFVDNKIASILHHTSGGLGLGPTEPQVFRLDHPHTPPIGRDGESINITEIFGHLLIQRRRQFATRDDV
jgi:hypothetical protein